MSLRSTADGIAVALDGIESDDSTDEIAAITNALQTRQVHSGLHRLPMRILFATAHTTESFAIFLLLRVGASASAFAPTIGTIHFVFSF